MPQKRPKASEGNEVQSRNGKEVSQKPEPKPSPRSLDIAARGVRTSNDFSSLMSALMSDLIDGRVTPAIGNATCNAGGKLLKVIELQFKYGVPVSENGPKTLMLTTLTGG